MASLFTFAIILTVTCGVLFVGFLAISFAIRREDNRGSLTVPAPAEHAGTRVTSPDTTGSAETRSGLALAFSH